MHYANLDGRSRGSSLARILQWKLGLHQEKRPRTPATGVPVPAVANDGRALRKAQLDALTWIGQASFLIQLGGRSALVDPVMSSLIAGFIPRNVAPGLAWAALPKIDLVLVTHNHRDHMDLPTLKRLGADPVYVVPRGLGRSFERAGLRRVVEMNWWQQEEIEGMNVIFVPAEHWSRRGLFDTNASWWGGYVIERGGLRVYHSGDTAWFDGFAQIGARCGAIDAAMLPIGAYAPRWFMRPQHMDPGRRSARVCRTRRAALRRHALGHVQADRRGSARAARVAARNLGAGESAGKPARDSRNRRNPVSGPRWRLMPPLHLAA